jgi:hypothetical protein
MRAPRFDVILGSGVDLKAAPEASTFLATDAKK